MLCLQRHVLAAIRVLIVFSGIPLPFGADSHEHLERHTIVYGANRLEARARRAHGALEIVTVAVEIARHVDALAPAHEAEVTCTALLRSADLAVAAEVEAADSAGFSINMLTCSGCQSTTASAPGSNLKGTDDGDDSEVSVPRHFLGKLANLRLYGVNVIVDWLIRCLVEVSCRFC